MSGRVLLGSLLNVGNWVGLCWKVGFLGLYISLLTTAWVEMAWLGMGMGTPVHDFAGSDTVRIGITVWAFGGKRDGWDIG